MKNYVAQRLGIYRRCDVEMMGRIGNLGTGAVEVSGKNNCVFVTLEGSGQVVEAINQAVPLAFGAPIWVGYSPDAPASMKVLRPWSFGENDGSNVLNSAVPNHHGQHEYPNADLVWVWGEQFVPMLPAPDGLSVMVYPGTYRISGGWKQIKTRTSIDLSNYVPGTAGQAKIVLIVLTAAGAFAVRDGTAISGYDNLGDANIPEPVAGDRVICGVKLFYGQTAIRKDGDNDDFIDARFSGANGGSSGYDEECVTIGWRARYSSICD